jgi:hypothetical protein
LIGGELGFSGIALVFFLQYFDWLSGTKIKYKKIKK